MVKCRRSEGESLSACAVLKVWKRKEEKRKASEKGEGRWKRRAGRKRKRRPERILKRTQPNTISGDYSLRVPPVPIPNTVVKPQHAESTWRETAW